MKYYEDYRNIKLNSLANLKEQYNSKKNPAFLNILRYSGKMINPYASEFKYNKILLSITNYIHDNYFDCNEIEVWDKTIGESQLINELYKTLYNDFNYKSAESIPANYALSSYLIALEFLLTTKQNELFNCEDINKKIPIHIDIKSIYNQNLNKELRIISEYDYLCSIIDNVLRYLINYKCKDVHSNKKTNKLFTRLSMNHYGIVDLKTVIQTIEKNWKFFETSLEKNDNNYIFLIKDNDYIDYKIIQNRELERFNNLQIKISNYLPKKTDIGRAEQMMNQIFMKSFLFTDDMSGICVINKNKEKYKIKIGALINAYNSLKKFCIAFKKNKQKYTFNLEDVCPILKKEDIINIFEKNNISSKDANLIFNIFLLNGKYDFFDNPIVPFNNKYVLIPSAIETINVIPTILSLGSQFEFRGKAFENTIIKLLEKNGVKAKSLIRNDADSSYECDIAFIIDEVLYFCECKAWGIIKSQHDYYEYCLKINSAKEQLDRIVGYYCKHLEYVKSMLNYQDNIKKIKKIIITSNSVGINNRIGDAYLIDYYSLHSFLDRRSPNIIYFSEKDPIKFELPGFDEYKGNLTVSKLDSFLTQPAPVEIMKLNLEKDVRKIKIGTKNIIYDEYKLKYDINSNTKEYIKMLEKHYSK